jgi:hypothetical protein
MDTREERERAMNSYDPDSDPVETNVPERVGVYDRPERTFPTTLQLIILLLVLAAAAFIIYQLVV